MIDNVNSVPARIVIVGTSTMKLSDRFSQISTTPKSAMRRGYEDDDFTNGGYANGMGRGMVSDHMMRDPGRNFLYDDYMDNDLFGRNSSHNRGRGSSFAMSRQKPIMVRKPAPRQIVDPYDDDLYNDSMEQQAATVDPVSLPLDTYSALSRARRRRGGNRMGDQYQLLSIPARRSRPQRRAFPVTQEIYEYYEPRARQGFRPRARSRIPIQNRISVKRISRPNFGNRIRVARSPFQKSFRRSGGGGGKFANKPPRRFGPNRRGGPKKEQPKKKTLEELDRELDSYMKSGKHPRVQI